jgi:hypothetical protein
MMAVLFRKAIHIFITEKARLREKVKHNSWSPSERLYGTMK